MMNPVPPISSAAFDSVMQLVRLINNPAAFEQSLANLSDGIKHFEAIRDEANRKVAEADSKTADASSARAAVAEEMARCEKRISDVLEADAALERKRAELIESEERLRAMRDQWERDTQDERRRLEQRETEIKRWSAEASNELATAQEIRIRADMALQEAEAMKADYEQRLDKLRTQLSSI